MPPSSLPDGRIMGLRVQEGTLVLDIQDKTHVGLACLVVAAIPTPPEVEGSANTVSFPFLVLGDFAQHAASLARFLAGNPAYTQVVMGMVEILTSGSLDGGHCHLHHPHEPPPAAPTGPPPTEGNE